METVGIKIKQLPQHLQQEVEDFVDFLLEKKATQIKKRATLNWAGGLKEFKDQFTAIELQKKSNDWRD